jgi:hypothetical protein
VMRIALEKIGTTNVRRHLLAQEADRTSHIKASGCVGAASQLPRRILPALANSKLTDIGVNGRGDPRGREGRGVARRPGPPGDASGSRSGRPVRQWPNFQEGARVLASPVSPPR